LDGGLGGIFSVRLAHSQTELALNSANRHPRNDLPLEEHEHDEGGIVMMTTSAKSKFHCELN